MKSKSKGLSKINQHNGEGGDGFRNEGVVAALVEKEVTASEFVKRPIYYVCTHVFEIICKKWVQQSHIGTTQFRLMAFVSHTYLLCTINCHNIVA